MKTLIIYYSRTGITKKVAEQLQGAFQADIEEVFDTIDRSGVKGYILSGRDASFNIAARIKEIKSNLKEYDLIIIGTPIWAFTMATPIRSLILQEKENFSKLAFFCTKGGEGEQKVFKHMKQLTAKEPLATLSLLSKEVLKEEISEKLDNFIQTVKEKYEAGK